MTAAANLIDWPKAISNLITEYKDRKHPLEYKNLYQLLVMVVLSAQDSDANINRQTPDFFEAFPDMAALASAKAEDLKRLLSGVRFHNKKIARLQELASLIKKDENIPRTMEELDVLPGIGRKSANVILREMNRPPEGIVVDLHVLRVAPRLGIATKGNADKIEKQLMDALPKELWNGAGMAISFLGRVICRPTDPDHERCVLKDVCLYCRQKQS